MTTEPPAIVGPKLREYWNRNVSELVALDEPKPVAAEQERHRIYALMLMSLVHEYWNGNKYGRSGDYGLNETDLSSGTHLADDYKGHNIAAIAVNGDGAIIDFDFNHNKLFNSSAEHAEARLVRRVFSLAQLSDSWRPTVAGTGNGHVALDDYTTLKDVTIYTSLESCAQCAGVMALGRVRQVVYVQTDPGMYYVGKILRNLSTPDLRAPLPIDGADIELPYFGLLDDAFRAYREYVVDTPFWVGVRNGERYAETRPSMTSFLCTKAARDIYADARRDFDALTRSHALAYPDHRPSDEGGQVISGARTNVEVIAEAADFLGYAVTSGRRGTPHH